MHNPQLVTRCDAASNCANLRESFFSGHPAGQTFLLVWLVFCWLPPAPGRGAEQIEQSAKPNVLFIAIDDLNHWVGHLGRNYQTKTPNIDRLAQRGVTFTNAHCAAPICNPSRTALLSGRRPSTTGIYDNNQPYDSVITSDESLVTQFKNAGYETLGMGKLWHGGLGFPQQWTSTGGKERRDSTGSKLIDRSIGSIKFGVLDADDAAVPDTQIADYGISELGKLHPQPFFLTVGFHKPHMPWNVPRKYFDMHPLDQIDLPPVQAEDLADVPTSGRMMAHAFGDHARIVESGRWNEAVQAYLAAISYVDGQVGRVLDALDQSEYRDNTIVCLWGDHGWHLGEKEHWRKFALWEESTRAPLIWIAPGITQAGGVCSRPVDFMSIYPTLCDLAGVAQPASVQGATLRSLLIDPTSEWSQVALTTYGRDNHAVRSERWRYIRYSDGSEELYDHQRDPYEWLNVANNPAHAGLKRELAQHFPTLNVPAAAAKPKVARTNAARAKRRAEKDAASGIETEKSP